MSKNFFPTSTHNSIIKDWRRQLESKLQWHIIKLCKRTNHESRRAQDSSPVSLTGQFILSQSLLLLVQKFGPAEYYYYYAVSSRSRSRSSVESLLLSNALRDTSISLCLLIRLDCQPWKWISHGYIYKSDLNSHSSS